MGPIPSLSRRCVRAALGHPWPALHAHIPLLGFRLVIIMGVAHPMFPRVRGVLSPAEARRVRERSISPPV